MFTLSKIVTSTCVSDRPLEVVDEDLLEPRERRRVQSHREVDDLGDVGAPSNFNGSGVAT
jgi:hypothetical protein